MRQSAGILLYREGPQGLEVLLVHPSGAYNRRAPWSIPKGEPDAEGAGADADDRRAVHDGGLAEVRGAGLTLFSPKRGNFV